MSRIIADILQIKQPDLHHFIQNLELKTGKPGHDVRLIGDIKKRSNSALRNLKLEYTQATAKEVYFGLQEQARIDNKIICEQLGVTENDSADVMLRKCIKWISSYYKDSEVWAIKNSVIKTLLKKQPPKTLMKILGLRSVDSMLKRNSAYELYSYALCLESNEWCNKLHERMKKLTPSDFDTHSIDPIKVDNERINKLKKSIFPVTQLITPNYETGSIIVLTPSHRFSLDVIAVMLSLIESVNELKKHSAYFRSISIRPDFTQKMLEALKKGPPRSSRHNHASWNSFYRYLVGNEMVRMKVEQPHITSDDFDSMSSTTVLGQIDSQLSFWDGNDYVFYVDQYGNHVSMHVVDVVTNATNRISYKDARDDYGRTRLREELYARYYQHQPSFEEIMDEFLYGSEV